MCTCVSPYSVTLCVVRLTTHTHNTGIVQIQNLIKSEVARGDIVKLYDVWGVNIEADVLEDFFIIRSKSTSSHSSHYCTAFYLPTMNALGCPTYVLPRMTHL